MESKISKFFPVSTAGAFILSAVHLYLFQDRNDSYLVETRRSVHGKQYHQTRHDSHDTPNDKG